MVLLSAQPVSSNSSLLSVVARSPHVAEAFT